MSNRSVEEMSESTGRSESSTPIQKNEKYSIATTINTRCQICEISFETSAELQIHFQIEHVIMREGQGLRCPQKHCNKIFPNRFSLKKHIGVHFFHLTGK